MLYYNKLSYSHKSFYKITFVSIEYNDIIKRQIRISFNKERVRT